MKKTVLALAALIVLSGGALAKEAAKDGHAPAAPSSCTYKSVKLDCAATGSTAKAGPAQETGTTGKRPRLGIDIDPWIMPNTF